MPRFHPSPSRMDVSIAKFLFLRVLLTYGLLWSTPDRISIMRLGEMLFRNEWAYLGREWCTFQGEQFNYRHQFTVYYLSYRKFLSLPLTSEYISNVEEISFPSIVRTSRFCYNITGLWIFMQIHIFASIIKKTEPRYRQLFYSISVTRGSIFSIFYIFLHIILCTFAYTYKNRQCKNLCEILK